MLRRIMFMLMAGSALIGTAGCNTVRGVGADLQSAANSVDRAM